MVLNLTVYVRNIISFLYKQKTGQKFNFDIYIFDVIHRIYVLFFLYVWKGRPITIILHQISIPQAFIFQVHRGVATIPPLG